MSSVLDKFQSYVHNLIVDSPLNISYEFTSALNSTVEIETSLHMSRIANYEYNFEEFDDATRIKVYEKFRKIRSDIYLLSQLTPNP